MARAPHDADRGGAAFSGTDLHGGREAAALEEALALAGDTYDAALDPVRWPETLRKLAQFVGSAAAALVSEDAVARKGGFHFSWGDDPYYTRLYYEKYIYLNPHLAPLMLLRVGEVRSASSLISCDQFRATRFYREWAGPAGYCDNTFAVIEKSAAVGTFLAAPHHDRDSPVNGEPRRRMELIVPHVRRAVAIGRLIEMQRIDADALADAVDALSAGVLLVGDGGRVVRTNAAARAMLAAGDMLYLDDGVLAARGAREVHRVLIDAIAGAMRDDVVVGPHGVAIPLAAGNGDRYVAHLLPLTSGARRTAGRVSRAGAAVFVHKAELGGLLPLEAMARQFGLSPAELRVLAAVVEAGGSVPDIAEVLGVSEPTVKTHLRRLFDKTGTGRQADLVRLVAGYANPMIGQSGSALDPVTGARSESSSRTTQRPSRPAI